MNLRNTFWTFAKTIPALLLMAFLATETIAAVKDPTGTRRKRRAVTTTSRTKVAAQTVAPAKSLDPSLVALWRGNGDAQDSVGANHGTLMNGASFAPGVSGQAFLLDGANDYVRIPNSASLHLSGELTVEMWFKRADSSSYGALFDKRNWTTCNYGVIMSSDWGFQLYYNDPNIYDGNQFEISFSPVPSAGVFHHLAGTFRQVDSNHIELKTYIDGQLSRTDTLRGNLANTFNGDALAIGTARDGADGFFRGMIDEVALYNRALSASEVASHYNGTSLSLAIDTQPQNATVYEGGTASLSVSASGASPLGYQWHFTNGATVGATSATLTISNAQASDAGPYFVVVSDASGSVTSAVATLTVLASPTNVPSGLVSLWRADGNALDAVGGNHGTLKNGIGFTAGVSGQAFLLDGLNDYVRIPDSESLHLAGELTVEMWFKREDSSSYGALFDKRNWMTCNYGVIMSADWGFQLYYNDPGIHDGNSFEISFSPVPAPGVFHHLAGTFRQIDSNHIELKTYIDGQLTRTDTLRGNLANTFNSDALAIGTARDGADGFFRGAIDEVALYSRALSASEVQFNYTALATNLPPPPPPPTNTVSGIVSLWRADGNAQDSVGNNHGALVNGAAFAPGVSGEGFLLDGVNDYVRIPDSASLHLSGELTVEMWFKREDASSYGALIDKRNWTTCNYGVIMSSDWGFQLYYNDPGINDGNQFEISFSQVPAPGVFHHLAGTFRQIDSGHVELKTYIDGQLVRTDTRRGNLSSTFNGDALAIGTARDGADGHFRGIIDEVALYGRALTASEVYSNYSAVVVAPPPPPPPPPTNAVGGIVALWRADGNAQDSVGGNHGTLAGGAGFTAGVSGQAFQLDGVNDFVRIPDSASLHIAGEVTLEMWFKREDSGSFGTLIDKRNWSSCNYGVIMSADWGFQVYYNDPAINDGNQFEISFSGVPSSGIFHHFAGTFRQIDSNHVEIKTYIDGQLVRTDMLRGNLANTFNTEALAIGAARDGADSFFRGAIDEVALYNRVLTAGEVLSNYVAISSAPQIITQPRSMAVVVGDPASFTVNAIGADPIRYQWVFEGNQLSGETNNVLTIASAQTANAGSYAVIVANDSGSVTSVIATLTVSESGLPPSLTSQPPGSNSVPVGVTITFAVTVSGTPPFAYQWSFEGVAIPDATNRTLSVTNAQAENAGTYRVTVTNAYGAVNSHDIHLTVTTSGTGGTVNFANLSSSNRVYDVDGVTPIPTGAGYVASLSIGPAPEALTVLPNPASFVVPGRFLGGTRTVPWMTPGSLAYAQVRVWDSTISSSYEEAVALGAKHGTSDVFQVSLGGSIIPPGSLSLMQSFLLEGGTGVKSRKSVRLPSALTSLKSFSSTPDGVSFVLAGTAGAYTIETSTDLQTWTVVSYVLNNAGAVKFSDPSVSSGTRFYRARLVSQ